MSDTLDRREFLKLSSLALGGLSFRRLLTSRTTEENPYSLPVEFRLQNHVLSPEKVGENISVVMGETHIYELTWRRWGNVDEMRTEVLEKNALQKFADRLRFRLKSPGVNSSDDELERYRITLAQLKSREIELVATDLLFPNTLSEEELEKYYEVLSKGVFPTATTIALTSGLIGFMVRSTSHKILSGLDKKKTIMSEALGPAATISSGVVGFRYYGEVQKLTANEIDERLINFFIDRRNTAMAHNSRIIESLLGANQELREKTKIDNKHHKTALIFAGSGHLGLKGEYEKGGTELALALGGNVSREIKYAVETLHNISEGKITDTDEEDFLNFWIFTVSAYSFPVASFYEYDEYKNADIVFSGSTGRELLWYELLKAYGANEKDRGLVSKLIARLAKEDITFFGQDQRALPEIDAMVTRMLAQRRLGNAQEIPLYGIIGEEAGASKPVLIFSEGVPFVMSASDFSY